MEGICFYQPRTPEDSLKNVCGDGFVRQLDGNEKYYILSVSPQLPLVTLAATEKQQKYSPIRGPRRESEF